MYKKFVKRLLDLVVSGLAILILSPLLLVIALAIKLDSRGPVLFVQDRIGLHKKRFRIYKFRSMRSDTPADVPTHLLRDPHASITGTGRFLRRTSLDELPQIFNIFKGEMSIIGPRPALWNQYDLEAERDRYGANDVLPGLTGWAQINGRDELPIAVKAALDGEYVRKMSLAFDMKCFLKTFRSVLRSEGVAEGGIKNAGGSVTKDAADAAQEKEKK
jgi:O-antigen biosynthesis protein WbqP